MPLPANKEMGAPNEMVDDDDSLYRISPLRVLLALSRWVEYITFILPAASLSITTGRLPSFEEVTGYRLSQVLLGRRTIKAIAGYPFLSYPVFTAQYKVPSLPA